MNYKIKNMVRKVVVITKREWDKEVSTKLIFGFKWLLPIIWILVNLTLMSGIDGIKILRENPLPMLAPFIWLVLSIYITFRNRRN